MNCSKCGNPLKEGAAFCTGCGTPASQQAASPPTVAPPPPPAAPAAAPPPPPPPPLEAAAPPPPPMVPQYAPQEQMQPTGNPYAAAPQQFAPPPPPPQDPGKPKNKKSPAKAIIISCIAAAVLIAGGVCAWLFWDDIFGGGSGTGDDDEDKDRPTAEEIAEDLEGVWVGGNGSAIYFFEESETIEFTLIEESAGQVTNGYGDVGDWNITGRGKLRVTFDDEEYDFTVTVDDDALTLKDSDDDERSFERAQEGASTPTPTPDSTPTPTPTPDSTPTPTPGGTYDGTELEGYWVNGEGSAIYVLWNADYTQFTLTGIGEGRVLDVEGNWCDWYLAPNGNLHIIDAGGETYVFTYAIFRDTITLTDVDGDERTFTRSDGPPPSPTPRTGYDGTELEGRWVNGRGEAWLFVFGEVDEIEFTLTGEGQGRVTDEYGEWQDWYLDDYGSLVTVDADGFEVWFEYEISGNELTLMDSYNDARTFTRMP